MGSLLTCQDLWEDLTFTLPGPVGGPQHYPSRTFRRTPQPLPPCQDRRANELSLRVLSPCQDPEHFRLGRSKLFFRSAQIAYLEKLRAERLLAAAILLQAALRGWVRRRHFRRMRAAAAILQRYIRGFLARR